MLLEARIRPHLLNRLLCTPQVSGHVSSRQIRCAVLVRAQQEHTNTSPSRKQKLVFLGTPEVAASVLERLLAASRLSDSTFEVSLVVSQPGKPKGRGNVRTPVPSLVEQKARQLGLGDERITCPAKAKDAAFLQQLEALQPDLCITAAYGNILPQRFLDIPLLGTLNIHPSLLPKYRGAAPVQRALQDGVEETGVSVAYTVLSCDAGPVLAQCKMKPDPEVQAPELLSQLFDAGVQLLLEQLPDVFEGRGLQLATPQDESAVVHAAKLTKDEGVLDFRQSAVVLHRKVCAFAGWPGTSAAFWLEDIATGKQELTELKIIRTRSPAAATTDQPSALECGQIAWTTEAMLIACGDSSWLHVTQVQPTAKKAMSVRDLKNGLRGKQLRWAGIST